MASKNEWDPLQTVIVGDATGARIPEIESSLRLINYADVKDLGEIPTGLYPTQVIEEANEDLELFCTFLRSTGATVIRPDPSFTPNYYHYCPRDGVLVHDNLILATPQPLRSRDKEYLSMAETLKNYGQLTVAECAREESLYNWKCLGDPEVLALNETEPCFDAANILRDNDNLYYLVSNSGNKAGARYLQELCPTKKVYTIEDVYAYMHLDSTISLLREGLMLLNPSRIKSLDQLPKPLQSWDYIWCPDPGEVYHYPGYCNSSKWINVNLLMVNPHLAAIESNQHELRVELEKYNIECAMIPARHQRTLGGGFHCVTLDLERKHG